MLHEEYSKQIIKIIDVNNDNKNELLITSEQRDLLLDKNEYGRIACFDYKGYLIWKYNFHDIVKTASEIIDNRYKIHIIDTSTEKGKKVLYLRCNNFLSFPSAIFKLDLKTGKRLEGIFWNTGHIVSSLLIHNNNLKGILSIGLNNSNERPCFFFIPLTNLSGVSPSTSKYHLINYSIPDSII